MTARVRRSATQSIAGRGAPAPSASTTGSTRCCSRASERESSLIGEEGRDHAARARHALREMVAHLFIDRCAAASRRAVDDHGEAHIVELELARERRFRHARHADDIAAVALQPVDLRGGLQPWPLRRAIGPASMYRNTGTLRRAEELL